MAELSPLEQSALHLLAKRLRQRFGDRLVELALFGSRARGAGRDDSDLDVFVSLRELTRADRREVQDLAFDLGFEHGLLLSPLLADAGVGRLDPRLAAAIAREGRPL